MKTNPDPYEPTTDLLLCQESAAGEIERQIMSKTTTPRTDDQIYNPMIGCAMVPSVSVEFSRTLELETITLRAQVEQLREALSLTLIAMLNHAGWSKNHRADGSELPMSRPADVAQAESAARAALAATNPNKGEEKKASYPTGRL